MGITPLNLDANASFGLEPEVYENLLRFLPSLCANTIHSALNPSSIHQAGQSGRALVEEARANVSKLVGAGKDYQIVFTSGATEANNMAINCALNSSGEIITSAQEHPSVLEPIQAKKELEMKVFLVDPTAAGVKAALTKKTRLVSIMLANNETGEIFPVKEIASEVRKATHDVIIHTDAVQAVGKLPVNIGDLGVDCMSLSGHKIGALTGVGALIAKKHTFEKGIILGGPQEGRLRAGTENLVGIVSLGLAALKLAGSIELRSTMMKQRRAHLENLLANIAGVEINRKDRLRLPNTISLYIPGVMSDDLVVALDLEGILVSSGAACASGKPLPSHVLLALGQSVERARSTIRISVRGDESITELERAGEVIVKQINAMRGDSWKLCA